ncbi:MAG: flotillin domain-containing protein [Nocardioides sp.]
MLATGEAEATAMTKRAEAFAQYNQAAVLQMLVEILPQVAREVAAPMGAIDKLTVVSTDGAGHLPRQVTDNIVQTMELLKNATGVDLQTLVDRFAGRGEEQEPPAPKVVPPASS